MKPGGTSSTNDEPVPVSFGVPWGSIPGGSVMKGGVDPGGSWLEYILDGQVMGLRKKTSYTTMCSVGDDGGSRERGRHRAPVMTSQYLRDFCPMRIKGGYFL